MSIATAMTVSVDREEYSKCERDRDTITVSIFPTPSDATLVGEVFTVELCKARRNRDVVVTDTTYTVPAGYTGGAVNVEFDLTNVVAVPEGWSLVRRGEYFINVDTATGGVGTINAVSDDFFISLMTVEGIKETYLFGIPLQSNDTRAAKYQPRLITGVTIKEVSRGHPIDFFPFRLQVNASQSGLAWSDGDYIPIVGTSRQELMLPGSHGHEWVVVEVVPGGLPSDSQSESVYIEQDILGTSSIRNYISNAIDYLENEALMVYLEPTSLVTDIDPTQISFQSGPGLSPVVLNYDYDFIKTPLTYYPIKPAKWIDIQFPFNSLLRVDSLFGAIANTRVVDINLEWIEVTEANGLVQLVPFNQELAFDFLGLTFVEALRGAVELPNFWHYSIVAGLRECPGEIRDLIGWKSAINALTVAGQAYRGGFASQSISRDGVSESVSYTASAIYGIYSATIEDYRKNLKEALKRIRQRYAGANLWVV